MFKITDEKREEIFKFYLKYSDFFSDSVQDVFCDLVNGKEIACDVLFQFYTYMHAIEDDINPYYDFYKYLREKHPNMEKRKILEVASGYIPAIAYILTLNEEMENIITTIDPKSLPIKIEGINKKIKKFTLSTNIEEFDLLISHCPCEALTPLLTKAINEKKEFSIQICKCGTGVFNYISRKDWLYYIDSIFYKASVLEDDNFIIDKEYLDLSYVIDAPIITARKKALTKSHQ